MSGKRGGRPFRGRKRFFRDTFAPGGTPHDPLNIEIELADVGVKNPSDVTPNPKPQEKPSYNHKRRKQDHDDRHHVSPMKHKKDHGSPKKHEKRETKEERESSDFRKNQKEYFNKKYRYGNFDRYYGVRLNPGESDKRLTAFNKEWFEKKSVLDIGCNVGFLTLSIAKDFCPRRILGIDIDEHLIGVARKNIRHYCDHQIPVTGKYPASFSTRFGNISQHTEPKSFSTKFPDNVWFKMENFVLEKDELLEMVEEEFDVIMALSVTKWIHLNWGDDGMRRFLRRAYNQLTPGGRLIIEPQPFESYRKRAKMSEELKKNYLSIEFKPEDFEMYLLEELGFETVENLAPPVAKSKGFERGIDVYVKPLKPRRNVVVQIVRNEETIRRDSFPTPEGDDE